MHGPPSSSVVNYRPMFIISVSSKVFEHQVSVRLGRFTERSSDGILPAIQLAQRKGLGTCDARLCVSPTLQSALESGPEARIVQVDFSDRVNHRGILYKLYSVDIGGYALSILIHAVSITPITARYGGWVTQ